MKKITLSLLIALCTFIAGQAQNEPTTLFGKGNKVRVSGFGGPSVGLSMLDGTLTMTLGGGGGVMLNNFFIGGYGSTTTTPNVKRTVRGENLRLKLTHGGIWTGYDIMTNKVVHLTTSLKIGWGYLRLYRDNSTFLFPDYEEDRSAISELVGTVTPELGVEINMTHFFKLAITGGYQIGYYNNIKTDEGNNINLSGAYGAIAFKFGLFGKR